MNSWNHKRLWSKHGENFCVSISCHEIESDDYFDVGPYRWCVYLYVYPKHPLFTELENVTGVFNDKIQEIPLHGGASLHEKHCNSNGEITSIQIGADYNHLYDSRYTYLKTEEEAREVFDDANILFNYAKDYKK